MEAYGCFEVACVFCQSINLASIWFLSKFETDFGMFLLLLLLLFLSGWYHGSGSTVLR